MALPQPTGPLHRITQECELNGRRRRSNPVAMQATHIYEVRPRKDHRGVDLISDALPFFFPKLRSAISVEQVGMGSTSLLPNHIENVFATLRVARIIFESQMANDAAPQGIDDSHKGLRNSATS